MPEIHGHTDPKFAAVRDVFAENLASRNEVGAALCVTIEGETVIDIWGGHRDRQRTQTWDRDTICTVFSNTKAATALCVHILIERGQIDPDAPVTRYWPDYGQAGKDHTTVRMLLNHTAGLPALRDEVKDGAYADWDYMVGKLAAESPWWEPGTRTGYHMITFGWLVGELVRRVTGRSLGRFFADEVAGPLKLDFHIGLPDSEDARVAPVLFYKMQPTDPLPDFMKTMLADTGSMQAKSMLNLGNLNYNDTRARRAEIGGAGGIGNARGLAGMFTPLANGGGDLVSPARIDAMRGLSSQGDPDANLMIPTRFGQGVMLCIDNRPAPVDEALSFLIPEGAFGHVGAGGSCGFADPDRRLAFAYVMNQMGGGFLLNGRGQGLIDAIYGAL